MPATILNLPPSPAIRAAYAQGLLDCFYAVRAAHDATDSPDGKAVAHVAACGIFDLARPLLPPHAGEGEV